MTKVKKMLGMVMAALMCFALTPMAAFAETEANADGTITINNAVEGQTYTVYKILDLESFNSSANAYSYTIAEDSPWMGFIIEKGLTVDKRNGYGYVTWAKQLENDSDAIAQFAKDALAYAQENDIAPAASEQANSNIVSFRGLSLGYYLVDSSTGTLCSLDTNTPDVNIREKNPEPTLTKEVLEGDQWGEANDATIGATVKFRGIIDAKDGAINYVYHDLMSEGLTFTQGSVQVYKVTGSVIGELTNDLLVASSDYTVTSSTEDGCTFEVAFNADFCNKLTGKDSLVITYDAVVNANAVIAGAGNNNEAYLAYGDSGTGKTEKDSTKTYTWNFGVHKYFTENGENKDLAGATFKLTSDEEGLNVIRFAKNGDVYKVDPAGTTTEFTSPENGRMKIEGLDAGTYYLHETAAPSGYNSLAAPLKVVIIQSKNTDGVIEGFSVEPTNDDLILNMPTVQVENKTGLELPSTGGIGTMVLYVIGGLLVLGAVVVLVRRRSSAK